jgi:two-component system, NarL family, response regulator LiaR
MGEVIRVFVSRVPPGAVPSFEAVSMLRVTLISDDEIVRRGVVSMLHHYRDQIALVNLSRSSREPVDIALFDTFTTGPGNGPNVARLISDPRIRKVVVYTWNFQPWVARDVLEQGVSGYLSKSLTASQLVAALQHVHAGKKVVLPSVRTEKVVGRDWPGREQGLTAREAEVLALITMGLSNADIAKRMSLSPNSIKSHIRACYRKIDVTTRSKAVGWGISHGMRTVQAQARPAVDSSPVADVTADGQRLVAG